MRKRDGTSENVADIILMHVALYTVPVLYLLYLAVCVIPYHFFQLEIWRVGGAI